MSLGTSVHRDAEIPLKSRLSAAAGPSLPGVSTTVTLTPRDNRGREILDQLEASSIPPFRYNDRTGARSYWTNAQEAPTGGYEAGSGPAGAGLARSPEPNAGLTRPRRSGRAATLRPTTDDLSARCERVETLDTTETNGEKHATRSRLGVDPSGRAHDRGQCIC